MRTVKVVIEAAVSGAIANVQAFKGTMVGLGSEIDKAAVKHPAALNKISTAAMGMGVAMLAGFGLAERSAMAFDKQMSAVGAVAEANAKQLDQLRQASLNAGRDTAFTATQAATAEEELAKAGMGTADVLSGGLTGALNLAAAGSLDLGTAATIAAQAMNEFGLAGKDIAMVADTLTAGANKSATDVAALGESLSQVGGIAHQAHMSLQETVGTLAAFAQNGLVGEEAGTTLKQMLLKLEAPSDVAKNLMKQLGINIYDASGQMKSITGITQNLTDSLTPLDEAQRNAALGTIFGARAIRGATILYKEGASALQDWIYGVSQSGTASDTAAKKLDNLSGDLHKLMGSLQAVAISSSGGVTSGLRFLAQGAEKTVNAFLGLPKPIGETATVLLGVSGGSLLAAGGLLKAKTVATDAMEALRGIGPIGEKAAGVLGSIGKWGGIAGVAAVGVFALWEGFKALSGWMDKSAAPTHVNIDQLTNDLKRFANGADAAGVMAKTYGADLKLLVADIQTVQNSAATIAHIQDPATYGVTGPEHLSRAGAAERAKALREARAQVDQSKASIGDLDKTLAQVATNGGATQAKLAFDRITRSLMDQGVSIDTIDKMFPQYAKAASDAGLANTSLAKGFTDAAGAADVMSKGLQDAINHGQTLSDVFKELNGGAEGFAKADIDVKQALSDLKDGFQKGKQALDDNTQAGRDNLNMIFKATDAAAAAAQAKLDETGSVEQAVAVYNQYIAGLRATLRAAGLTDAQINNLINTYAQMPPAVTTQVNAPGLAAANANAAALRWQLDALNGRLIQYTIRATQETITVMPGGRAIGAQGGIFSAASGASWAGVYPPSGAGLLQFAEQRTGGETLIPNQGISAGRGLSLADYAARHYGGHVVPAGGQDRTVVVSGSSLMTTIIGVIKDEVRRRGGNVQAVLGG